jgi:hypothetical protein
MKCFIASAFGRADVDTVYDRYVRPVLKRLSVQALRVDRVEHNEDIDNKIFELLDEADFAIVDLTYARPSVYYEAGYAAGSGKPVVYIARNDHFRARDGDPEGLLRVHFDLQMKNIISWSEANDAFSRQLDTRLRHVLRPLLQERDKEQKRRDEYSQFGRLPQNSQIELLGTKACSLLKARGFSLQKPEPRRASHPGKSLASRESDGRRQDVAVLCTPSAVKRVFDGIEFSVSLGLKVSRELPVQFHYVIVSLKAVPQSRVTQALSSFRSLDDGALHRRDESKLGHPAADTFVHVIDGVKSESKFADAFRSILARYHLEKGA